MFLYILLHLEIITNTKNKTMFKAITSNLKGLVADELMSKVGLKDSQVDDVVNVSAEATKETFASKLSPSNLGGMMNLFSSKDNNDEANGLQNDLTTNIVSGLIAKVGLPKPMADMAAKVVVPKIIGLITKKNEETDESDTSGIMGMFGGDKGGDIGGAVKNLGKFF